MIIKLNSTKALIEFSKQHENDAYRVACHDATGLHYLLTAEDFIADPNVYFVPNDLFIEFCCKHRALNVSNACALACDKDVRVWYGTEAMGCAKEILRYKGAAGHPFFIVGAMKAGKPRVIQHIGVLNLANYTVQDIIVHRRNTGLTAELDGVEHGVSLEVANLICENIPRFDVINKVRTAYVAITYPEAPFLFLDNDWAESLQELWDLNRDKEPEYLCNWVRQNLMDYINSIRPSTVKVTNNFLSLTTKAKAFKNPFPCVILRVNVNSPSFKAYKGNKPSYAISVVDYLKSVAENWSKSEIATDFMDEYATLIYK